MTREREALARAEELLPETMEMLRQLVRIDTGTGCAEGVDLAGGILARAFEQLGFGVERLPAGEYGSHLSARRSGRGRPIFILGHLDTVHARGTARDPGMDGEMLSGPGVFDCKGGLAVCLAACRIWAGMGWPASPLTILINADEEIGSLSSRALIEAEASRSRAALIVEPTPALDRVITARRGIGRYMLRVFGRSAHTGQEREKGINALVELCSKILALEQVNDTAQGYTVTVGTAAGGVRPNVVPEYAQAEIDLRINRPEAVMAAEEAVKTAAAVNRVPGASYRLEGGITRPPMPENERIMGLFHLAAAAGREIGLELGTVASGGGSDANFCASRGIPVLDGLGPAGGGAHSEGEHILWRSLAVRAALLAGLGWRIEDLAFPGSLSE